MTKNQNKTLETSADVDAYLLQIEDETKRLDCLKIKEMMERIVGAPAKMWGTSIIGFGTYHYKYESGREGDFMRSGFAARKANIVLYIMSGFSDYDELLEKIGKYKTGKSCLYIKRLSDIDESILEEMVTKSVQFMAQKYPE
ncbi:DUF1801 domain-containing protein [Maritalea sp.]|uniref:DUF1801 domain-containing protein n=1 Tax=Maritalea sp. TaxID=2003361 RepID=UPI003EF39DDB